MTGRALRALLLAGLLLLLALTTGSEAAFLFAALILALLAVALLSCLLSLFTLRFTLSLEAEEADRGSESALLLFFVRHSPLPTAPLSLSLTLPGLPPERYLLDARPWGESHSRIPFTCPHAGRFRAEAFGLSVEDCFGYFRLPLPGEAQRLPFLSLPLTAAAPLPEGGGRQPLRPALYWERDSDAPEGMRDWRLGDELKRVHWKLSLRRQRLTVRTHEALRRPRALLLLSGRLPQGETAPSALTDALLDLACGLAQRIAARGGGLLLLLPGGTEIDLPGLRPGDLPQVRRALAGARFGAPEKTAGRLMRAAVGISPADEVNLVSAVLDAAAADALLGLQASGVPCSLFCGEEQLPARLRTSGVRCYGLSPAQEEP